MHLTQLTLLPRFGLEVGVRLAISIKYVFNGILKLNLSLYISLPDMFYILFLYSIKVIMFRSGGRVKGSKIYKMIKM